MRRDSTAKGLLLKRTASWLLALALLTSCGGNAITPTQPSPAVSPAHAALVGVITDAASKKPVRGAAIRVTVAGTERSATTDDEGRYAIADLPVGGATIAAVAPGYEGVTRDIVLEPAETRADLALPPVPPAGTPPEPDDEDPEPPAPPPPPPPPAPSFKTTARVLDLLDDVGLPGAVVSGDGITSTTSNGGGELEVSAVTSDPRPRRITVTGAGLVDRTAWLRIPGPAATIDVIPAAIDLAAFDELARTPHLRRWTSAPPLVLERRILQATATTPDDSTATASPALMTDAELADLEGDLTWALDPLTGGVFTRFASVRHTTAPEGASVHLLNSGQITVARIEGLRTQTGFDGFARWEYTDDGRVTGALILLDRQMDKAGDRRHLRAHELGHALGYNHVTRRASLMQPVGRPGFMPWDRDAMAVAYRRKPGNRSPDIDPGEGVSLNLSVPGQWSRAVGSTR